MNTDTLRERIREQVRQALTRAAAAPVAAPAPVTTASSAAPQGALVVPLRVGSPQDTAALTQLFQRLAASPALLQMADAGLLRFDLRVDASALHHAKGDQGASATSAMAATTAIDPATCCESCKQGKACECTGPECSLHAHDSTAELDGVIGERQVKALAPAIKAVRLGPKAVLTPLGKETLRKRGITIDRGAHP